jgi:hypothetical protein
VPTRRAVAAGGLSVVASGAAAAGDPLAGAALYADLNTYAGFGHHRTGTRGDAAVTAWLSRTLKAAGYAVELQAFDFPVFEVGRVEVQAGGGRIAGFPLWTPRATSAAGVTGPLTVKAAPGAVALVTLPDGTGGALGPAALEAVQAALGGGVAAVVAITDNPLGELAAVNALPKAEPWPVPIVLVAGRDGPRLRAAAGAGQMATVTLSGRAAVRRVENVVARRTGSGKHLVISTPKSGWMTCAGERGSGVAIWLGLGRWLAAATKVNTTLVATTCHEFDGYGGHMFTERLAPKPADTRLWLHLGANVASYDFALKDGRIQRGPAPQRGRLCACSHALVPKAAEAFRGQPDYETPLDIETRRPPGEAALFQRLGYDPLLALVGGHPLHHTPRDLPDVSGPELLEPVARALQSILTEVVAT